MSGERWLGHVSAKVVLDPEISVTAKATYAVLAVHADRDGYCWPSQTRIAAALGMSRRSIVRSVDELRRAGVVRTEERHYPGTGRQVSSGYTLLDIETK